MVPPAPGTPALQLSIWELWRTRLGWVFLFKLLYKTLCAEKSVQLMMWQYCMAGNKELLSQELSFRDMINFLPQNPFSDTFFL